MAGYGDYEKVDGDFYGRLGANVKFNENWGLNGDVKLGRQRLGRGAPELPPVRRLHHPEDRHPQQVCLSPSFVVAADQRLVTADER